MTPKEFEQKLKSIQGKLYTLQSRTLPIKAGAIAKSHFQQNFRKGGFVDGGLRKWKDSKRQHDGGKGASSNYGPLLSKRNHLYSSIQYIPGNGVVRLVNLVPYAGLHNEGGIIETHPNITPKMRKFAWAQYYKAAGISKRMKKGGKARKKIEANIPNEALKWKRMALTKKTKLNIRARIPQRQFMGNSAQLNVKLRNMIDEEIRNVII